MEPGLGPGDSESRTCSSHSSHHLPSPPSRPAQNLSPLWAHLEPRLSLFQGSPGHHQASALAPSHDSGTPSQSSFSLLPLPLPCPRSQFCPALCGHSGVEIVTRSDWFPLLWPGQLIVWKSTWYRQPAGPALPCPIPSSQTQHSAPNQ